MAIKTLHLTNAYHPASGGIRTFYRALMARADAERRPMTLVVPGADDECAQLSRYVRLRQVRAAHAPVFDRRYRLMMPSAYLPAASSRLAALLAEEAADLVEICDKYTLPYVAALVRRGFMPAVPRPTLVGLSCERMDDNVEAYLSRGALPRRLASAYMRHIYGPPFDAHLANSEYTADELRHALWDRDTGFIRVCTMGVDFQGFGPAHRNRALRRSLLEQCGGTPDSVLLLYAGRVSPEKNVGLLLDVMTRLSRPLEWSGGAVHDFRLVVAGDGPLMSALAGEAAARLGTRIHFLGDVPDRARLAALYASADVCVHPNPREPFGIAPLEAMASRVPVVLPSAGGVLSYAHPGNAWLAAPDAASFAYAIRSAATDPMPSRLAEARETARRHDWDTVAARHFALLETIDRARRRTTAAAGYQMPISFHQPKPIVSHTAM